MGLLRGAFRKTQGSLHRRPSGDAAAALSGGTTTDSQRMEVGEGPALEGEERGGAFAGRQGGRAWRGRAGSPCAGRIHGVDL